MRGLAEDMHGGSLGSCSQTIVKTTQGPQPLKDARNRSHTRLSHTRLYEEHRNRHKADLSLYKMPYGSMIKIVSLNARSLLKPTMHRQIIDYMRTHQVHIVCLQETKSKSTTQYVVDNYTFMTISTAASQSQEYAGVGFVLCPQARGALLRTHYVHSRLACVTLLLQAGELSIVNAHAPHNARPEEERQDFFDELQHTVDKVQAKGPFVIVGDFNARLHGRLMGEGCVTGPFVYGKGWSFVGEDTDNRQLLVDFCRSNELLIAIKQVTYKEPGTKQLPYANQDWDPQEFAQIDFCLAPMRWRNSCITVFSQPRANLDSDHFPLVTCLRVKLGAQPKPARYIKWDFRQATLDNVENMNKAIEQQVDNPLSMEGSSTDIWEDLSKIFLMAIDRHIPQRVAKPSRPWISEATLQLLERRGQLRMQGDLEQVAELNREIRRAAKRDKRIWLDEQLETGDWSAITNLRKPFRQQVLTLKASGDGVPGRSTNADIYAVQLAEKQWKEAGEPEGLSAAPVLNTPPTISEATISMEEVRTAIKQTKSGKRGGKDQIPSEFFKALTGKGLEALLALFRQCFDTQSSPAQWNIAQVVAIFKKGDADDPSNYRPISLLQTCYKLYARIIANRLSEGLGDHIRELQYGFRRGRSTSEAIYLVRRLQDLVDAKQHQALYLMFLDWSKAFDRIRPSALFHALTRLGVPAHTCEVIRELVSNPVFEVIMGEHTSECRQQQSGIRQGCTLSPLLFILLQTVLFHDAQLQHKHKHPLATTPHLPFFDVEFADDTVLIARTREQMQDLLLLVQQEAAKYNLHLNLDKTKLILYNSDASVVFSNGDPVPQVSSIVYLGGLIDKNGRPGPEVRRRIGEARAVFQKLKRVWRHAGLSKLKKAADLQGVRGIQAHLQPFNAVAHRDPNETG